MLENNLPELSKSQFDHIVDTFKSVYQPATKLESAAVRKKFSTSTNIIVSEWSQYNLEKGMKRRISRTLLTDALFKSAVELNTADVSNSNLNAISSSERFKAVICTRPSEDAEEQPQYFLEIWDEEKLLVNFDLAALDLHGAVYTDDIFGSLSWSRQDDKIAYIAERKRPKVASFYERKTDTDSKNDENEVLVGNQYAYEDDWGEQLSPKTHPVIVVCDVPKKSISLLEGVPDNISPGQVLWQPSGNGVVGLGLYHTPRRLGRKFCTNRPSCVFSLSLDGAYEILSDEKMAVLSPRFSPDGKYLIWLQRTHGGPHWATYALVRCEWRTKQVVTIVDVVQSVVETKNGKEFYGIYCDSLPKRCWTSDNKYVLFSTCQAYRINSYAVDIDSGDVYDIGSGNEDESTIVLDISEDDFAICERTSFTLPSTLACISLSNVIAVHWNNLTKEISLFDYVIRRFAINDTMTKPEIPAMYFGPKSDTPESVPLILFCHGGPHSSVSSVYTPLFHFFAQNGFGTLIVNYTGSLGCGEKHVRALLGNNGVRDILECYSAVTRAHQQCPWLHRSNVVLFGGSYGGFLVTRLSSQYPGRFKSVVTRNPVVNSLVKTYTSDAPDLGPVLCGFDYNGIADVITNEELCKKMIEVSPMRDVRKVETPTLLLLGKKDLRVPFSQGLSYYHALKEARQTVTKVLLYDDNHSLSSVSVEMDSVVNSAIWFHRCLKAS